MVIALVLKGNAMPVNLVLSWLNIFYYLLFKDPSLFHGL